MRFATLLDTAARHEGSTLTLRVGQAPLLTKRFPELVSDVRRLRDALTKAGLRRGLAVGLQAANTYEFVVWDLALIELGAIAHVFPDSWQRGEMERVAQSMRLVGCIGAAFGNLCLPEDSQSAPARWQPTQTDLQRAELCDDPDLLTRVYSSGTSGYLKGLVIGRAGVEDVATLFAEDFRVTPEDRHLFFLTMTHFQQRLTVYTCLAAGVSLMITPFTHVLQDLPAFKPTFFVAPPLFYELSLATLAPRGSGDSGVARMKAVFGSQLRFMITGMAPIRRDVLEAYRSHDIPLLEAYGMTEVGLIAWNTPDDNVVGTVGTPLRTHRLRFADDGEILVKAPHAFARRYFDVGEEESARTFVGDGFIATGDIGEMAGTHLVLRGRKKDIIVTSDGHKFHPAMIESQILACAEIRQAFVVSDPASGSVLAVVSVENPDDAATRAAVQRAIAAANDRVKASARIVRTIVTAERFTPENGLMTPTLKPNRSAIANKFAAG